MSDAPESPKCLIVDDEISADEAARSEFLRLIQLSQENVIFAQNYQEALEIIREREDLAFCFLDCRIPRNSEPYDYTYDVNEPGFVEWGMRLIPELHFPTIIISAFVSSSSLKEQEESVNNIVGFSEKPFRAELFARIVDTKISKAFNINKLSENTDKKSFDYTSLDPKTSDFVRERTEKIRFLAKRVGQDLIDIGTYLIEIKEKLGHGNFYTWLDKEFSWSQATAKRLIRVAKAFGSVNMTDLDIVNSALYILAAPSTPESAKNEAIEKAKKGQTINSKLAKGIRERHIFLDQSQEKKPPKTRKERSPSSPKQEKKPPFEAHPSKEKPKHQILEIKNPQTIKNSFWQLGREGYFFCGAPDDSFFLNKLPASVASTIIYIPQGVKTHYDALLEKSQSRITFSSLYDLDFDLDDISTMLERWLNTNTDGGDTVVFAHLLDESLLTLVRQMGCDFFLAEPNPKKAQALLDNWKTQTLRIK